MSRISAKGALKSLLIVGILAAYFTRPFSAHACTTTPTGRPAPTVADRVAQANLVFTGTVIDVTDDYFDAVATIEVEHYFKGGTGAAVVAVGGWGPSSVCRTQVSVSSKWLFYINQHNDGSLHASWLTAGGAITQPHGELLAEIAELTAGLDVQQPGASDPDAAEDTPETAGSPQTDESDAGPAADEPLIDARVTDVVIPAEPEPAAGESSANEQSDNFITVIAVMTILACSGLGILLALAGVYLRRQRA